MGNGGVIGPAGGLDLLGIHPLAVTQVGVHGQVAAVPYGPLGHAAPPLLGVEASCVDESGLPPAAEALGELLVVFGH